MSGIPEQTWLRETVRDSLFAVSGVYRLKANGDLQFDGARPGVGWHAHGYFPHVAWMLRGGQCHHQRVWKRRWLQVGTTHTCHSRPPDDLPGIRFCTLVVTLKLWSWLDSTVGLHRYTESHEALEGHGSRRSVQRWLRRYGPRALEIQQAIRLAAIERCEPRPLERIFPTGLDPPERLRRKQWKGAIWVGRLWTALALLLGAAFKLKVPIPNLLAEARRRCERIAATIV